MFDGTRLECIRLWRHMGCRWQASLCHTFRPSAGCTHLGLCVHACVCVCTCGLACATHVAHLQVAHTWACGICLCPKVAPAPQLGSPKAPAVCLVLCMETSYSISLVCSWPSSQVDPKTGVPTLFYTGELTFPVSCGQASFGRHALDMHKLEPHPQQLRAPQ